MMIEKRKYQEHAIKNARMNNYRGVLNMATGTGKTFTSLLVADDYFSVYGRMFLVVIAPFNHLITQWAENSKFFNFDSIIELDGGLSKNREILNNTFLEFYRKESNKVVCIITYDSFKDEHFQENLKKLSDSLFLIADECHNLGSAAYLDLDLEHFRYRIGLSATPSRHYDNDGTEYILSYFENELIHFSLNRAINEGYLTPYTYEFKETKLTDDEMDEFEELSLKMARIISKKEKTDIDRSALEMLMIKRSLVLKSAKNKIKRLLEDLARKDSSSISHTLVYCAPGTISEVTRKISNLGIKVHQFDYTVSNRNREIILDAFSTGHIQVLVAMNCLDEGVDIPATKEAYFLSSTTNPKEFIQRRGRILRNYPGKDGAKVIDFITLPPEGREKSTHKVIRSDIPRIIEFISDAKNKDEAKAILIELLKKNNAISLLDKEKVNYENFE